MVIIAVSIIGREIDIQMPIPMPPGQPGRRAVQRVEGDGGCARGNVHAGGHDREVLSLPVLVLRP